MRSNMFKTISEFENNLLNIYSNNNDAVCLHKSKWAVTIKKESIVRKYFFHLNPTKICKEVALLRLSTGIEINLIFDINSLRWYYEMPYINLYPFNINNNQQKTFDELHKIFNELIRNDWNTVNLPYYIEILKRYLPNNQHIIDYLSNLSAEHFIHGDFTISNVYYDYAENIIVLDYENATNGPYNWDECTLAYSFIENSKYEVAQKIINEFNCSKQMLLTISAIRLAQTRKNQNDDVSRYRAYQYICNKMICSST